jgi:hypothetical protein
LNNVENTALSTWAGTANITTVGTLSSGNATAIVDASSTTKAGKVELATEAETSTGTDATRAVTPDGLAGSVFGLCPVGAALVERATACTVAQFIDIPLSAKFNGMELKSVVMNCTTAGTTGTMVGNIRKNGTAMLSVGVSIDSGETTSTTAATGYTIKTDGTEDVVTGDVLSFEITSLHTTAALGCSMVAEFGKA